jgi:hypothetical protein
VSIKIVNVLVFGWIRVAGCSVLSGGFAVVYGFIGHGWGLKKPPEEN